MKMKKYIFLGILLIIAGGVYYFMNSYEAIVKNLVHKYGSEVTGTDVSLQGFKLSLTNGEGTIKGISVGNPKGYKSPNLFELGEISVKVNLKSLTSDTIVIDHVIIKKPVITYEMLSLTQNNIKEIQNNINNYMAKSAKDSKTEKAAEAKEVKEEGGKKVVIKKLHVEGGELAAITAVTEVKVPLPAMDINGIGENKGKAEGTTVAGAISKIFSTILTTAQKTVVKNNLSDLKNVAKENLDNVVGGVKDRVKSIGIFGK